MQIAELNLQFQRKNFKPETYIDTLSCSRMKLLAIKRLAAFSIDYALIALLIGVLLFVNLLLLTSETVVPLAFVDKIRGHATGMLTLTLPVWLYFTLTESIMRQATVGKLLMRLMVVDCDVCRPTVGQAAIRNAIRFMPWELAHCAIWYVPGRPYLDPLPVFNLILCVVANLLAAFYAVSLFIGNGVTIYDRISGTRVQNRSNTA